MSDDERQIPLAILERERELAQIRAERSGQDPLFASTYRAPTAPRPALPLGDIKTQIDAIMAKVRARSPEEIAEYERSVQESRDREAREAKRRRLKQAQESGLACTIDTWRAIENDCLKETHALQVTKRWLSPEVDRRYLALIGGPGVGKTVAAGWAAVQLAHRGIRYIRERQMIQWFRRGYDREIDAMASAHFVIVDELGTHSQRDSDLARLSLLETLDARIARGRTMLIGNMDRSSFATKYDARIIDRLRENGAIVECKGSSMRAQRG
jgi:DNA replication protein DnaC